MYARSCLSVLLRWKTAIMPPVEFFALSTKDRVFPSTSSARSQGLSSEYFTCIAIRYLLELGVTAEVWVMWLFFAHGVCVLLINWDDMSDTLVPFGWVSHTCHGRHYRGASAGASSHGSWSTVDTGPAEARSSGNRSTADQTMSSGGPSTSGMGATAGHQSSLAGASSSKNQSTADMGSAGAGSSENPSTTDQTQHQAEPQSSGTGATDGQKSGPAGLSLPGVQATMDSPAGDRSSENRSTVDKPVNLPVGTGCAGNLAGPMFRTRLPWFLTPEVRVTSMMQRTRSLGLQLRLASLWALPGSMAWACPLRGQSSWQGVLFSPQPSGKWVMVHSATWPGACVSNTAGTCVCHSSTSAQHFNLQHQYWRRSLTANEPQQWTISDRCGVSIVGLYGIALYPHQQL